MSHDFPEVLPVGVEIDGQVHRDFEVLEVDGNFEAIFTHKKFAAKHPQQWAARCAAAILKSIGPVNVRDEFAKSGFTKLPQVVQNLSLQDLSYVLFAGHVHTYGPVLEEVQVKCPECNKTTTFTDVDLSDLSMDFTEELSQTVVIDVSNGWVKAVQGGAQELGFEGIQFNRFTFVHPQVRHAIVNEKYYSAAKIADFNLRIAQSAIIAVERVERVGDGDEPVVSEQLDERHVKLFRNRMLLEMKGKDRRDIRRGFSGYDRVKMEIERDCSACEADITMSIDTGNLYPLA